MTLKKLSKLLKTENEKLNLLSSGDIEKLESKHFVDCQAVLDFWKAEVGDSIIDLGTGGGLPGLVLALAEKKMNFSLLDSTEKKIKSIKSMVKALGMKNVKTLLGRCEVFAQSPKSREKFDIGTARALAPLPTLLELAAGFIKPEGYFYAWKGENHKEELELAENAMNHLGMKLLKIHKYKMPEKQTRYILEFQKTKKLDMMYPRKDGVPLKSPL